MLNLAPLPIVPDCPCDIELLDGMGVQEEQASQDIQEAIKVILQGLGEDISREGLRKTPLRVAKALLEGTSGCRENPKDIVEGALFPESDSSCVQVNVQGLSLFSFCESCLLPFQVQCHVSYVPSNDAVVGLSKLSRVAAAFAKRLQDPQRLADEICTALYNEIKSAGVGVILNCLHIRFPNMESLVHDSDCERWMRKAVRSGCGVFEDEKADVWVDFLRYLKLGGNKVDFCLLKGIPGLPWCPNQFSSASIVASKAEQQNQDMVVAVSSLLKSLGEDPARKELVDTPRRFIGWLMSFRNLNLEMKLNCSLHGQQGSFVANGQAELKDCIRFEQNLALWSQCEHHLLPFYGKVHIGFVCPEGRIPIRKSLLQSIVHFYGFKLQVQERLTSQIANTISSMVEDVIVFVEAEHMCMMCRGVKQIGSKTITEVRLGKFLTDRAAQDAAWDYVLSVKSPDAF